MENILNLEMKSTKDRFRVIEDCLNGRITVWEDLYKPGRNGLQGLAHKIEAYSPLYLVILMLGTNDFQSMHQINTWNSSKGLATLVSAIRLAPIEPGMPTPPILIIAPPKFEKLGDTIQQKFMGAEEKSEGLSDAYRKVAELKKCKFFDASLVITSSAKDGVHLDLENHLILGQSIADVIIGTNFMA